MFYHQQPGSHLVCIPCNKWFESTHNFREHSKSRKHQRNVLEKQSPGKKSTKSTVPGKQELPVEVVKEKKKTVTQGMMGRLLSQFNLFSEYCIFNISQ